jgi:hypothetical protein
MSMWDVSLFVDVAGPDARSARGALVSSMTRESLTADADAPRERLGSNR